MGPADLPGALSGVPAPSHVARSPRAGGLKEMKMQSARQRLPKFRQSRAIDLGGRKKKKKKRRQKDGRREWRRMFYLSPEINSWGAGRSQWGAEAGRGVYLLARLASINGEQWWPAAAGT